MRPASIVNFERLFLGAVAVGILSSVISWGDTVALVQAQPGGVLGEKFVLFALVVGLAINLLLWYFIARRASVVAKWILTVLVVIGTISMLVNLASGAVLGTANVVLGIVSGVLQILSVWMLFRPDAVAWFAGDDSAASADVFS